MGASSVGEEHTAYMANTKNTVALAVDLDYANMIKLKIYVKPVVGKKFASIINTNPIVKIAMVLPAANPRGVQQSHLTSIMMATVWFVISISFLRNQ